MPALFLLLAIGMFYINTQTPQDTTFIVATIMMLLAGVLTLLYSSGRISSKLLTILGIAAFVGAAGTLYFSTVSVMETNKHIADYKLTYGKSIMNLSDIRTAQKAYMEEKGYYAQTWEELVDFIKTGKVPSVETEGSVPNRKITEAERAILYGDNRAIDVNMTEKEAVLLSLSANPPADLVGFRRDTVMVSFLQTKFKTKSYTEARKVAGFGAFSADSLPYIPGTTRKWKMETKKKVKIGEQEYPVIKVSGRLAKAEIEGTDPEDISFGSLSTNDTGGSWEAN